MIFATRKQREIIRNKKNDKIFEAISKLQVISESLDRYVKYYRKNEDGIFPNILVGTECELFQQWLKEVNNYLYSLKES